MASKVLYDTRNNQIMRCQPEPHGSAELPGFEGLCRSARIPENEKGYMETCIITNDILTNEAVNNLRINNGKAILKPLVELSTNKTEVDISANEIFTLSVEITDTLTDETFSNVDINIEDAVITIDLTDNQGTADIEIADTGKYTIQCEDSNFRTQTIQVEGV